MTEANVTLEYDPSTHDFVDPFVRLREEWRPPAVIAELGITAEDVRKQQESLAIKGHGADPARRLYMLLRMAPYRVREHFEGPLRRAHDFYDAAEVLRRFFHELTGELLRDTDEIFDASDGEWKRRVFGHSPRLGFTPKDLTFELKRQGLYPHAVHLSVEGETEGEVFRVLLEAFGGRPIDEVGIEISLLGGVGKTRLHSRLVRAARVYAQFPVVVTDREGDVEKDLRALTEEGILPEENVYLWDTSFEEANFADEELVRMAQQIAERRGAPLELDAAMLRSRYASDRARRGKDARGLAEVLLDLARHPAHGSVRISKVELAEEMAKTLVEAARAEEDEDELLRQRPVLRIVFDILRVT